MRKIYGAAALAALALTVSACASSGSSTATTGNTPAAGGSSSPAAAGGNTVSERTIGGQQVVTDSAGKTLYWFGIDTPTAAKCTGSCATYWPPVKGPGTPRGRGT